MNLSIRNRLILMATVPVFGLLVILGQTWIENGRKADEAARVHELAELGVHMSALVHELQKERGLTAGFLGSRGARFRSELAAQRATSDERAEIYGTAFADIDVSDFGSDFQQTIEDANERLARTTARRRQVDDQSIALGDALGYYTKMNGTFLDAIAAMVRESPNPSLSIQIGAYVRFLKGKERAGIERAVLTNTFAADQFKPGMYARWISLVSAQSTFESEYLLDATDAGRQAFEDFLASPEVGEVQRYREIASTHAATGGFGADPKQWFQTITAKIDGLKQLEDQISARVQEQASAVESAAARSQWLAAAGICGVVGLTLALTFWIVGSVTRGLDRIIESMREIAEGDADLTQRLHAESEDEIGELSRTFNTFISTIQGLVRDVMSQGTRVDRSSGELTGVAGQMGSEIRAMGEQSLQISATTSQLESSVEEVAREAQQSSTNVTTVAAAVEEMSINISEVAKRMGGLSGNVQTVASSVDQMSDSVTEVAGRAEKAATTASQARERAVDANETMRTLGESAGEIGKVVDTINDVADQTNLLALNATIEAAAAGDAGRGFAVVANEVKELAKQTAAATEEIRVRINAMQESASAAAGATEQIVTVIEDINEISQGIAASVAQQREAATEIASSVGAAAQDSQIIDQAVAESSEGAAEAAQRIEEISLATSSIARSMSEAAQSTSEASNAIAAVSNGLQRTAEGARSVEESADDLSSGAKELASLVTRFHV